MRESKADAKELLDKINRFIHLSVPARAEGRCIYCDSYPPNHAVGCEWSIARNELIKATHEIAQREKLGMYKQTKGD
jgi:hypothetical protein